MQIHQQPIEPNDYQFYCNPNNPSTLVMLRQIDQMNCMQPHLFDSVFPNYYFLHHPQEALGQQITLKAAITQQTDRNIMVSQFCRLAELLFASKKIVQQFLNKYANIELTDLTIILKQYTKQSFFYQLINRVLKTGKDPLQLFYAQYFTKTLHKAIKNEYIKQNQTNFTSYRGAYLSDEEIEELSNNIGKHIQTLGFLSTSLNIGVAFSFMRNILIQIEVTKTQKHFPSDYGFAFLDSQQKTYHVSEQQVLFNALCSFQVVSVGEQTKEGISCKVVKLKYGVTYELMQRYEKGELIGTQQQLALLPSLYKQHQKNMYSQIDAISFFPYLQAQQTEYCKKSVCLWQNICKDSEQTQNKNVNIAWYKDYLYRMMKKSGQLTKLENKYIQLDQTQLVIEKYAWQKMVTNINELTILISNKIRKQKHKQAAPLFLLVVQQLEFFEKHPKTKIFIQQKNKLVIEFLKKVYYLIKYQSIQLKINLARYVSQFEQIAKQISELKMSAQVQNGSYHMQYRNFIDLESELKQKAFEFGSAVWIQRMKFKFLTQVSADSKQSRLFQVNLQHMFQHLKNSDYKQVIAMIIECAVTIVGISTQKWKNYQNCFINLLRSQIKRLMFKMQLVKVKHLVQACKQTNISFMKQIGENIDEYEKIMSQSFQSIMKLINAVVSLNDNKISSFELLERLSKKQISMKSKIYGVRGVCYWFVQCLRVNLLNIMGSYEQGNNLKEVILGQFTNSTYYQIIADHLNERNYDL